MAYQKGYRTEKYAVGYMKLEYDCECVESRGSHGVADLICGNGEAVYVIQVKSGKKLKDFRWKELEEFARLFKGVPLLLFKPDYRPFVKCWNEGDLKPLRDYLYRLRKQRDDMQ